MASDNARTATFSSSSIWKLMTNGRAKDSVGAKFDEYVREKQIEQRTGRPANNESYAQPTTWGDFCEAFAIGRLQLEFEGVMYNDQQVRRQHMSIDEWTGVEDGTIGDDTVFDVKCPFTMKSFCELADAMRMPGGEAEKIEALKNAQYQSKGAYYWQLVSNAILLGKSKACLAVFCPYKESNDQMLRQFSLPSIAHDAANYSGSLFHEWQIRFIYEAVEAGNFNRLPYLIEGKYYNDLEHFTFTIPQDDIDALTARVELAAQKLKE